jgi:FlaA1/EpsC-like NDP-sugar epimerase
LIDILKEKFKAKNKVKIIGIRPGEKIHELLINETEIPRTYKVKNLYVIASHIEKYKSGGKPIYLKPKNKINESKIKKYSSKDHLIKKSEVKKIFKKLGLI